jgi:alpha-beta hydrolase superfamily lysophospholipase
MFSRSDAQQLRANLSCIKFLHGPGDSSLELNAQAAAQYARYSKYYGLNFSGPATIPGLQGTRSTIGTFSSGPYHLVCQHFVPEQYPPLKTVFLLHGYFDHAGLYRHLIKHLLAQKTAVVIFDLPGHGLSSGAIASIGSFSEYTEAFVECLHQAVQQKLSGPWLMIGQSTGASVILDTLRNKALDGKYPMQGAILLAPLLRPRHWLRSRMLFSLSKLFVSSTPRKFSNNSHDVEFLRFLDREDDLQSRVLPRAWVRALIDYINRFEESENCEWPVQIIQGTSDETVHWETNIPKILGKFPGSKVHWVEEAGHHLVNESTLYRDQAFSLIDKLIAQFAIDSDKPD